MSQGIVYDLSVTFALVTGSVAGVLTLLSWKIFRTSPFGRVTFAFMIVMATFTLYHGVLLALHHGVLANVPSADLITNLIESVIFTGLAVVTVLVVRLQHRMQNAPDAERNPT